MGRAVCRLGVVMVLALAAVGAIAIAQPNANTPRSIAVVVITDCGADIDDQWALTHLLLTRGIDVKAIVATHAVLSKLTSETTQRCVNDVLEHVRSRHSQWPSVARGSDGPIEAQGILQHDAATDLLLGISRGYSKRHRLTVLVSGAATELAFAIQREPSIVNRISVVAMGFEDWDSGDEFNVKNDPAAWRAVLAADVPLVIGSAAVTKRDLRLSRDDAAQLIGGHGQIGAYLNGLFDAWLDAHPELVSKMVASNTWVIWDDVVTAYLLGMTQGERRPGPVLSPDLRLGHPAATARRLTWLTSIDAQRVWNDLARKIDAARPNPSGLDAQSHSRRATLTVIPVHEGRNAIDILGGGQPGVVDVADRENFNAHGHHVAMFAVDARRYPSDPKNDAVWQVVPFFGLGRDSASGEEVFRTAEGADCNLRDLRVVRRSPGEPITVVVAERELGSSFADQRTYASTISSCA